MRESNQKPKVMKTKIGKYEAELSGSMVYIRETKTDELLKCIDVDPFDAIDQYKGIVSKLQKAVLK
jgi:hypothetical protein